MKNKQDEETVNLYGMFMFKHEETVNAIKTAVCMYEGVLPEQLDNYINFAHSRCKANLFLKAKKIIKEFWKDNENLTLSDVSGLFSLALTDIENEFFKRGDEVMEKIKSNIKSDKKG